MTMRFAAMLLAALLASFTLPASAWNRLQATRFATLPAGTAHPEGITVDPLTGTFYVADFDVSSKTGLGNVVVFDRSGRWQRTLSSGVASNLLLGIAFNPKTGDLLVCDLGVPPGSKPQVVKIDVASGQWSTFVALPPGSGPNALAFDKDGNVYISDSFTGTIWRAPPAGGSASAWATSDLLATSGVPGFGANGLAFDSKGSLFVANTGNDTVVRIPVNANGDAGDAEVFVNSINGADGLIIDGNDNLWVAANQADEIVVVDPSGRAIAKLGDFDGLDRQGAPVGLLFPASPVFFEGFVYVTNLSLDLRLFKVAPAVESLWAAQVTRHTIARLPALIPPIRGAQQP